MLKCKFDTTPAIGSFGECRLLLTIAGDTIYTLRNILTAIMQEFL
jgi:hypothetical protein